MNRISRFASIVLAALQLPLFSSAVTYGKAKKLVNSARGLVSPKKDGDDIENKKGDKTKGKGQHKVDSVRSSKVRDKVKSVVNGVVDDFFDRPIGSSLKYLGIPFLCYEAFSIIKNEIYNCRHFPSRMKPELIIYLVENNFRKWPSEDDLEKYCRAHFSAGRVCNCGNWETKKKMMNYLAGILMTNYYLAPGSEILKQIGYTIVDMLLFRSARDRVSISAKRFLNNKSGSCFAVACYLLLFMESLGVEARLAFEGRHACLVLKEPGVGWFIFDPALGFASKCSIEFRAVPIKWNLLVLEEIKQDDKQKITQMRCASIKGGTLLRSIELDDLNYVYKVPFYHNW